MSTSEQHDTRRDPLADEPSRADDRYADDQLTDDRDRQLDDPMLSRNEDGTERTADPRDPGPESALLGDEPRRSAEGELDEPRHHPDDTALFDEPRAGDELRAGDDRGRSDLGEAGTTRNDTLAEDGALREDATLSGDDALRGDTAHDDTAHDDTGHDDTGHDDTGHDDTARADTARGDAGGAGAAGSDLRSVSNADQGGENAPLVPAERTEQFTQRWNEIKGMFVDEPRQAVQQADALVGELLDDLERLFREQRQDIERGLENDDTSTEDLRMALRRYRSFFDRLLAV